MYGLSHLANNSFLGLKKLKNLKKLKSLKTSKRLLSKLFLKKGRAHSRVDFFGLCPGRILLQGGLFCRVDFFDLLRGTGLGRALAVLRADLGMRGFRVRVRLGLLVFTMAHTCLSSHTCLLLGLRIRHITSHGIRHMTAHRIRHTAFHSYPSHSLRDEGF